MEEIWKDIIGYEGLYQVSSLGRVKSLVNKNKPFKKNTVSKVGYYHVAIWKNNKQLLLYIHRLIGIYFIDNPDNKKYINHINGNKLDNRIENLEWVTNQENSHHSTSNRANRSSKYVGVFAHSGKWESACWFNNKKQYIGRFKTEEEAREAYINFLKDNNIVNKYA